MKEQSEKYIKSIMSDTYDIAFSQLYSSDPQALQQQKERYANLIYNFAETYTDLSDLEIFITPGRTEIGGNHTDHNAGRILASAVSLDIVAVAASNQTSIIRINSEGYYDIVLDINDLSKKADEVFTSIALVRGVCARLKQLGYSVGGFSACISGQVPKGSGLSSSAAFEVLIVSILNHFFNSGKINDILNAQIAQFAENEYFGKPCGLMDQTTCAVGGLVTIDFKNFDNPVVEKVNCDFSKFGLDLFIIDTGGNHADMNNDYIELENEMKAVAKALGGIVLREIKQDYFLNNIHKLRNSLSDRAILRAFHFFDDDLRVVQMVDYLQNNNISEFLGLINQSGDSSWMCCQNYYSIHHVEQQGISVAVAVSKKILQNRGAVRVHGGGFAGTIQAFVPYDLSTVYQENMTKIFGENSCYKVLIRNSGTIIFDFSSQKYHAEEKRKSLLC
jgi:galactokinase